MIQQLYQPFKHWSENGSVYILSDTHFDDDACKLIDENWVSSQEQVDIINQFVHKNDTFIHLGDVGNKEWVKKIKTSKRILIAGNHDKPHEYEDVFSEIYKGPIFISPHILLSHEPINLDFCLNIHGHDHSNDYQFENGINLAANVCGYTPVNLKDIITSGILKNISSIHRLVIDKANEKIKNQVLTIT